VHSADELIDGILNRSQIPPGKQRREIQRELRAHIEDFVIAARQAGRGHDEIEKLALAHFGDPAQIALGFAWVYRHDRRRLRVFAFTLSTVLLASSLFAGILAIQAGLALGFGTPLLNVFTSRHTVIEALDILASVAAYLGLISLESLFKSHSFQKAAFLLMAITAILVVACGAAGLHIAFLVFGLVNGVFFRTVALGRSKGRTRQHCRGLFSAGGIHFGFDVVAGFTYFPRGKLRQLVSHGGRLPTDDRSGSAR
jgi:hypothetical protein